MIHLLGKLAVAPKLPAPIARLHELAYNLWWSWEPDAQALYARLDPALWVQVTHNPIKLLQRIAQSRLDDAAVDPDFLDAYQAVFADFDTYMRADASTWFNQNHPDKSQDVIAYFSAEFGLHEALPIYSGGLGILSGDHCKAASDLGLPFIGVGFLYPQGYFNQRIGAEGQQVAQYEKIDFHEVPALPALDTHGNEILIQVDLPGRAVHAKIWKIQVGRIPIYLMDTDVPHNAPQDRELSARLYGGDREMRISQEVVLGIGGVRAVEALGYQPAIWHMNEGHSAFLGLERVRRLVQDEQLSFDEAVEAVRADSVFTTHTPVPAGNDAFAFELIDKFFWQYWGQLGIDRDRFINFARQELPWGPQYSMTVLAIRLSSLQNGVSKLHGEVSRKMWQFLWPNTPVDEIPIDHVTNGIHTKTWLVKELRDLYKRYFAADWLDRDDESAAWAGVDEIPNGELWAVHHTRKEKLIQEVRRRLVAQYTRHGEGPQIIASAQKALDSKALTIGFARRFATYKRAALLFHDLDRIKRILNDPDRPVQIIFSGKAHPDDEPGKELIRQIYELSHDPAFAGKVVFVENYDMNVARHLISGVDVWLNTPRRPREASGTSGEKAAMSGVPNFSILDGWWAEGFNDANGWSIGEPREYKDFDTQDAADAFSLYQTLEDDIIPRYFTRDAEGVPGDWVQTMKNSVHSCGPRYSMRRMVIDYTEKFYLPAAQAGAAFHTESYSQARKLATWKQDLRRQWHQVHVEAPPLNGGVVEIGQTVALSARVSLHDIPQDAVRVEAVVGTPEPEVALVDPQIVSLAFSKRDNQVATFVGEFTPAASGAFVVGIRVVPTHPHLIHPSEMGLVTWARPT
ncbi:MAG: alpha-glucan family phosphorylase [Litorilinea sp.]